MVRNIRDNHYYLGPGEEDRREESWLPPGAPESPQWPPPQQTYYPPPPPGQRSYGTGLARRGVWAAGTGLARIGLSLMPPSRPSSSGQSYSPPSDPFPPQNSGYGGGYQPPPYQSYYGPPSSPSLSGSEMGRGCLFLVLLGLLGLVISAYVDPEFRWLVPVGIVMALIIARLKS